MELCLVRSSLSFTLSVLLMWKLKMHPMFGHRRNAPLLVARGVCGALSMGAYYVSLQLLPLGDAVTIGEAIGLSSGGAQGGGPAGTPHLSVKAAQYCVSQSHPVLKRAPLRQCYQYPPTPPQA
jgi:hypothetical protein